MLRTEGVTGEVRQRRGKRKHDPLLLLQHERATCVRALPLMGRAAAVCAQRGLRIEAQAVLSTLRRTGVE